MTIHHACIRCGLPCIATGHSVLCGPCQKAGFIPEKRITQLTHTADAGLLGNPCSFLGRMHPAPAQPPPDTEPSWNQLDLELEDVIDFAGQVVWATHLRADLERVWPRVAGVTARARRRRSRGELLP